MSKTGAMPLGALMAMACPVARTRPGALAPLCTGRECPLLREVPMTCNAAWKDAVQRVAAEIDDKTPGKTNAARAVAGDPEAHGLVREFFCGLGGRPE